MMILGILLIIAGALILAYHGFTYKKDTKVAQVGDVKLTAGITKTVYLSPTAGGILVGVGILMMILGSL